ncbi:hypothetical protein J5J86_06530 [Aquabacter sp. L1I39]|uniref:ImuA family protein n=1 Tax=Aquabacter sp. L1I39 TaxID=2820278 RepID=UPI001AD992FE|nr:hypothetical protein [Aquabacter sp. L1I39]QTL04961.1 hypothetical protein J5J86_06530 [Aquabacter sp. L1I39]
MMAPSDAMEIAGLRQRIAALERGGALTRPGSGPSPSREGLCAPAGEACLPLGVPEVDACLGGGLTLGALHEASVRAPRGEGALMAFALAVAARAGRQMRRPVLVVQQDLAMLEAGTLYGPGLAERGLPEGSLILVRVRKAQDALLVMEEALKCAGLSAILGEVASPLPEALTATRRLALAAQAGGTLGLLLRPVRSAEPCAARTRWTLAPAPSQPDAYGGLGPPCLSAALVRNRMGPPGAWTLEVNGAGFRLAGADGEARHDHPASVLPREPVPRPALSGALAGAPAHGSAGTASVA